MVKLNMSTPKKLRFGKWALIFLFLFFLLMIALAYYKTQKNKNKFIFSFEKNSENIGKLWIQSDEISSDTLMLGVLCVSHASDVSKVDLFMPDMGHGSSPPVVVKLDHVPEVLNILPINHSDYGCFKISKIEMFMPGVWQVRVFYKSYMESVFTIDVKR
jgi:hypothetical protein